MTLRNLLLPIITAALATAGTTTYSTLAAFQAAAGTTNTTTFEGIVPAGQAIGINGNTYGGVSILASDFQLYLISSTFNCQGVVGACSLGTGDMVEGSVYYQPNLPNVGTTTFTPGAGVYAFGFDFRAYDQQPGLSTNSNGTFSVSINGGTPFTITSTSISQFFGVVSTSPLTSIAVTPTGGLPNPSLNAEFFHFDNMVTGTGTSATPEPATYAMIGGGLVLGGWVKKRSRKSS